MTKSECYSQISICNAGIEEDQKKIREWEEKINLYENTNRRLERGQENMADFCSCHSRKIRQTRDYFPQVKYVEGYVQDMTDRSDVLLDGTDADRRERRSDRRIVKKVKTCFNISFSADSTGARCK